MRADRRPPAPEKPTSPRPVSRPVHRRLAGKRSGSVLCTAAAVLLFLAPGAAVGSMYLTTSGNAVAPHRRPIHAFERTYALGRTGAPGDPAELFRRQCVACHGKKGKGDGPAAAAMSPRPADLTDPERIGQLSDEELIEVLTNGRGAMPSFGTLLDADEIRAMVAYIRELSGTRDHQ